MATWLWNSFSGISDDSFLGRPWEYLDSSNIDLLDNSRYVDGAKHPIISEVWAYIAAPIIKAMDGAYPAFCTVSDTFISFGFSSTNSDGWVGGAFLIEQIWTASLPVTYFFKNGYIRQQSFDGASMPFNNVITTNVPSGIPTASCMGAGRMYFAVASVIYTLDTSATNPLIALSLVKATPCNSAIPFGYKIVYMYIYMDILNVVTTNGKSTTIYQMASSDGGDTFLIQYYHTKQWVVCIGASGDGNNIFWFSSNSIYLSNGTQSEKVKVYGKFEMGTTFSTNSICTVSDWVFKIADGAQLYEYGHIKPWYPRILNRKVRWRSITALHGRLEVFYNSPIGYAWRDNDSLLSPYLNYSIMSLPYEAGNFNQLKEGTAIRIGHILPAFSTYTTTVTLCSLLVQVLTDEMEQLGITTPLTVATITTPATGVAPRYTDIAVSEINSVITTAGYNPDFNYIKINIVWNAWDLAATTTIYWSNLWRKSPKFFGAELVHNDIKKWIPN